MDMFADIKDKMIAEIRPNSEEGYLEAVVTRPNLGQLLELLTKHLGPAAKAAGKTAKFSRDIQKLVDLLGGLRGDQSFFFKQEEGGKVLYAALWPWASNPEKITLKAGEYDIPARKKFLFWG